MDLRLRLLLLLNVSLPTCPECRLRPPADINLHEMKRYLDRESGKMYLLFDCPDGSKVAYTIYDPSIMNDYTISNIVKNMPHVTMDVDAIRRNYRLVAL